MQEEKKYGILKKHYREYYKDSFPADRLDSVVNQALCIKEETDAIMNAMDEYAQHPAGGNGWVKASEFKYEVNVPYHAKDSASKGAGSFDENGTFIWGDDSATLIRDQGDLFILDESPNEQPVVNLALNKYDARYELSLALRSILKLFKYAIGDDMTNYQKERYSAAEAMLKKHSDIRDVLRTESNEQPVEQKENEAVDFGIWLQGENYRPNAGKWYKNGNTISYPGKSIIQLYNEYKKTNNNPCLSN
jgi:hypothetical protein